MTKVWYKENPILFEEMKEEIKDVFPNLHFYLRNEVIVLEGSFPVVHDKAVLDRYSIKITFPKNYPDSVPVVEEVGGRIPRTFERHINPSGTACLFLPELRYEAWPPGSSFLEFLNGPVHNFFLGQSLVENGGEWPFGTWDHGQKGTLDYYKQFFNTNDTNVVMRLLASVAIPKIRGHLPCPCGSGKITRYCHFSVLLDLKEKIPIDVVRRSFIALHQSLNNTKNEKRGKLSN